jgi:hypothetical protein
MNHIRIILLLLAFLAGCAARTTIEPVGADNLRLNASLGGPLVSAFGTYPPIPNLTAGATYGISDRIDANGTVYLLPLLYSLAGFDVGVAWYPLLNDGPTPTLSIQPRLMSFTSFKSGVDDRFRIYPVVSTSAAWKLGAGMIYAGTDVTIPVSQPDYDRDPAPVIISPMIGYRWNIWGEARLYTELKWHGVNVRTNATVEYINPGGYGALSPFIGVDIPW